MSTNRQIFHYNEEGDADGYSDIVTDDSGRSFIWHYGGNGDLVEYSESVSDSNYEDEFSEEEEESSGLVKTLKVAGGILLVLGLASLLDDK
jgi:hypothetical protein